MPDVSVFYLLQMQSQPVRVRTDRSGVRTLCINGGMYILSQTQCISILCSYLCSNVPSFPQLFHLSSDSTTCTTEHQLPQVCQWNNWQHCTCCNLGDQVREHFTTRTHIGGHWSLWCKSIGGRKPHWRTSTSTFSKYYPCSEMQWELVFKCNKRWILCWSCLLYQK